MRQALTAIWYEIWYWISMCGLFLGFSLRVRGREHFPRQGPVLVIANHQSFIDPVAIGVAAPRHLAYLARKTLFNNRLLGWLIWSVNAVPVDQEGIAKEGLQAILKALQAGRAVLVFPEGERTMTGKMNPLRPGVLLLLKRTRAPIVPVGISGAYKAWPRGQPLPKPAPLFLSGNPGTVGVVIGQPIDPATLADRPRAEVLAVLFDRLAELSEQAEALRRDN